MFRGENPLCVASLHLRFECRPHSFTCGLLLHLVCFRNSLWVDRFEVEEVALHSLPSVLLWAVKLNLVAYSGKHSR